MQPIIPVSSLPYRKELPIFNFRDQIVSAIRSNPVVVITGETGCGKTTQLPLLCLEALGPEARIAVTQPRRIAAVSLAQRVANDMGCAPGGMVGFTTRFDKCVSRSTRVHFQTDGILVSEITRDRFFGHYDAIIVDEAHERNLNIDIIIGHLRWLLKKRRNLGVIVSSATINPELFSQAFGGAPIVRVEGRTFPMEIVYDPFDDAETDVDDAAARAVERICDLDESGDILVFMPTERDIITVKRKIDGLHLRQTPVTLPLFSRLSRAHQQRIFRSWSSRKIVIATNIAETSITVPGIRFVIDSGFARIKRYQPNSRITALPIERISRSSADQRAGRCGRTQEGVCIRLYSKDDYDGMEQFTPAEIARSNMAGVILTMLSQRLGSIDSFPFVEPPPPRATKDGHAHLEELGAIDENGRITPVGKEMAAFPLDPHLARILVAARKQGVIAEALVIVSALSCVDPRERPMEKAEAADQAHRVFGDPITDFVWYLNAWKAYHDEWETTRSQSRMRTFCRERFISFTRMKEWREVYAQLASIASFKNARGNATFERLHCCLLTGFIANIALLNTETKIYKMSHGATATIFPGSMLAKKGHPWIMFAEKVETSRVFVRTVSKIEPQWLAEVAPHLVRCRYSTPYFDEEAGTVRATEDQTVFGLLIGKSNVAYGRINPMEANEIFIREGLVEGRLRTHYGFFSRNRAAIESIGAFEAKLRVHDLFAGEAALHAWYAQRIPGVTSIHDLNREIHTKNGDAFLSITITDLLTRDLPPEAALWPDSVSIGGQQFPCTYMCDPLDPRDGVTVHVPDGAQEFVSEETFSWLMKPQWRRRIEAIIESLPREVRKKLSPISDVAQRCAREMRPDHRGFYDALSQTICVTYGVDVAPCACETMIIPAFLKTHVTFDDARIEGKQALERWRGCADSWEKIPVDTWNFGDIPEYVVVADDPAGLSLYRFPALWDSGDSIGLVLCATAEEATHLHAQGVAALMARELAQDTAWLGKNASLDREDRLKLSALDAPERILKKAVAAVIEHFGAVPDPFCKSQSAFNGFVENARNRLPVALRSLIAALAQASGAAASLAGVLAAKKHSSPRHVSLVKSLSAELRAYCAAVTSGGADYEYLVQLPRYLKRLEITVRRAMDDPLRHVQRMSLIEPYQRLLRDAKGASLRTVCDCVRVLEEYKISLFAQQEVKAAPGTSEAKVRDIFNRL